MASGRLKVIQGHLFNVRLQPVSAAETHVDLKANSEFYYTLNNPLLNYEQRKFYEENGYILISGLLEDELIDECCQRFVDICDGRVPKGNMMLMKDVSLAKTNAKGQYLYNKVQDILDDKIFEKYFVHNKLLDYVECFTGPNIKVIHSMFINKPPDSGKRTSRHPLHQDLYYFPFRPADRIVTAWSAMEKVTESNGCLVVIPGSHKRYPGGRLLQHDYPKWEGGVNKAFHGMIGCAHYETVPLIMEKGDTVFFHPLLIHGSGENVTKGFRKSMSCHYAASDCDYIDVNGTLQEKISEEIKEIYKRKYITLSVKELWQLKCKLVRGMEINL